MSVLLVNRRTVNGKGKVMKGKQFLSTVVTPIAVFVGVSVMTIGGIVACTTPKKGVHVVSNPTVDSVRDSGGFGTRTLYPCATEDSDNCFWDGRTMGNGPDRIAHGLNPGQSFVTLNGTTYYFGK